MISAAAWLAVTLAGVAAVLDWIAVFTQKKLLEYAAKPAVLVFLIAASILVEPKEPAMRLWFIVALTTSLAGDIFLMVPKDLFLYGLASFLAAHVGYTVAFVIAFERPLVLLFAAGAIVVLDVLLLRPILSALSKSQPALRLPVIAYAVAISAMVCSAFATGSLWAAAGAALFMFSDFMIARHRLVRPLPWAPLAIIVTYHLGQIGLVLSLAL